LTIEFEQGKYRNWQDAWYSKKRVNQLSHFFSGFLRHWGCTWKGNQSCDSGGWFLWMKVSQMLCKGYKDRLSDEAAAFHDVDHAYMNGSTPVFMLHALIPRMHKRKLGSSCLLKSITKPACLSGLLQLARARDSSS
jgi:hypothetical protein